MQTRPTLRSLIGQARDLVLGNAGPIAACMGAAVIVGVAAQLLTPAADPLTADSVFTSDSDASSYIRRYELFIFAALVAAFVQWVCGAAVMIGVRWIAQSYPSNPLVWLNVAVSRLPALFAVFMMASGAFLVAGVLIGVQLHGIYQDLADLNSDLLDPTSISLRFAAVRSETSGLWVFAVILVPLSFVLAAAVMLEDLRPVRAIALLMKTAFSQPQLKNLIALLGAIVAIFIAGSFVESLGAVTVRTAHIPAGFWMLPQALIEAAVWAFAAVVVALAWINGYVGPRWLTATTQVTPEGLAR
jgi:hypothetical protein